MQRDLIGCANATVTSHTITGKIAQKSGYVYIKLSSEILTRRIFGSRREARYVGGQWIDSKARESINMKTVERKGAARVINDCNVLNGTDDFTPVMTAISQASNDVRILRRMCRRMMAAVL